MLEIRRNRFAKPYENEFFRIFSKKLSVAFENLGIHGVLLGSPLCTLRNDLQLDALLITETGIVIIDFKNYAGIIQLPEKEEDLKKVSGARIVPTFVFKETILGLPKKSKVFIGFENNFDEIKGKLGLS